MGLQDVFFKLNLPFDSAEALALSTKIQEEIYYHAVKTSCGLAEKFGPHPAFKETKAARGILQFDLWNVTPSDTERWERLRRQVKAIGLRNSLMIAIAPTATIASIVGGVRGHRAADFEPVQAGDVVGRVHPSEQVTWSKR